jgi:hypothetical protein
MSIAIQQRSTHQSESSGKNTHIIIKILNDTLDQILTILQLAGMIEGGEYSELL